MALWIYDRQVARVNLELEGLMSKLRAVRDYELLDDRRLQNELVRLAVDTGEDGSDLLVPVTPRQFPRALAQQSVLTVSRTVATALPASRWIKSQLAACVRLREEWKPAIESACRSMGLSKLSLFRDYDSLGYETKETFANSKQVPDIFP